MYFMDIIFRLIFEMKFSEFLKITNTSEQENTTSTTFIRVSNVRESIF